MPKEFLGKTKNNVDVYINHETSHAVTHFAHQPKLFGVVQKIIPTIEAVGNMVRIEKDMREDIGTTDLVETTESDEIIYAKRPLRDTYSRFVKNKTSKPCSWVSLDLRKVSENEYDLRTAFVGQLTPSFPGGNYLSEESKKFWSTHALVWGSQEVLPGTETSECPW